MNGALHGMMTANERTEFAPPPTPGLLRALVLALIAHLVLVGFLALGVQWKRDAEPVTVEAELWSSIPKEAAPPPPPPVADPEPEPPKPAEAPKAPPEATRAPPPEPQPDPAIAIAREKRLQKEKQALKEKLALEKQKHERQVEEQRHQEALKEQKHKAEKEAKEKADRAQEQRDKLAQAEKAKKDKAKNAAEAKKLADLREQSIKRMMGLAGTSGDANARGTAAQSSGPSAGYAGRIRARIKPNITYLETISGNPAAEVEVRATATGTILSRKLTKSSGVPSWDQAVLNAIDKTEELPRDVDGRTPPVLILVFRPRD